MIPGSSSVPIMVYDLPDPTATSAGICSVAYSLTGLAISKHTCVVALKGIVKHTLPDGGEHMLLVCERKNKRSNIV